MSSVTNLAKNLTDTTRAHASRVAVRVDNAAMTYRAPSPIAAAPLAARRCQRARRRGPGRHLRHHL